MVNVVFTVVTGWGRRIHFSTGTLNVSGLERQDKTEQTRKNRQGKTEQTRQDSQDRREQTR